MRRRCELSAHLDLGTTAEIPIAATAVAKRATTHARPSARALCQHDELGRGLVLSALQATDDVDRCIRFARGEGGVCGACHARAAGPRRLKASYMPYIEDLASRTSFRPLLLLLAIVSLLLAIEVS